MENRTAAGFPRPIGVDEGAADFIEAVVVAVDHEHVAIAGRLWRAFDRRGGRHRIRAGVAFGGVVGPDQGHAGLAASDHDVRNADGRAFVQARAEVGVQPDGGADAGDQRIGIPIDGSSRDVGVPRVAGGERERAVQCCAGAQRRRAEVAVAAARRR